MAGTRCPTCKQFVKIDCTRDPVISDKRFDALTGRFTAKVRVVNCCQYCGRELAQRMLDLDIDFLEEMLAHDCPEAGGGAGWTAEVAYAERTDRFNPPNTI